MRHKPLAAQLGDTLQAWGNTKWSVQMLVSNRQVVETISVTCYRIDPAGRQSEGFHSEEIGPFDDLRLLIQQAMLEAALASLEAWESLPQELPYDPHTA